MTKHCQPVITVLKLNIDEIEVSIRSDQNVSQLCDELPGRVTQSRACNATKHVMTENTVSDIDDIMSITIFSCSLKISLVMGESSLSN